MEYWKIVPRKDSWIVDSLLKKLHSPSDSNNLNAIIVLYFASLLAKIGSYGAQPQPRDAQR